MKIPSPLFLLLLFISCSFHLHAQLNFTDKKLTLYDTLRGSIGPERNWWDVLKYKIDCNINLNETSIQSVCAITFKITGSGQQLQIDLQEPLIFDSCFIDNKKIPFSKNADFYFLNYDQPKQIGAIKTLQVYYHGKPKKAIHPPWDGGSVWKKGKDNTWSWMSVACQGLGASAWYPCKDHQSDEADSAEIIITCPSQFTGVSNGVLVNNTQNKDHTSTWHWKVSNPINNYCIVPYVGDYVHLQNSYQGENGKLKLDYWVLKQNKKKAKKHFKQVPLMLKALEYWFGPYPFYSDGYKLVEAPYLGMEHQSAIAYGNEYQNGYRGTDLSSSGHGLKWDFIIVHESGHEWFGNNITTNDIADMWVHEGFTNYSEVLFTEFYYGKEAADSYCAGLRKKISNDTPIIGPYNVNTEGSGDMYYKASNMIHTIRQIINNDEKFRNLLRGLNKDFHHQTVSTHQIEKYISEKSGIDLTVVFDQYLRTTQIPILSIRIRNNLLSYQWKNCITGFNMPVKLNFTTGSTLFIYPNAEKSATLKLEEGYGTVIVDPNFYIQVEME